jgi:hypothetical protein
LNLSICLLELDSSTVSAWVTLASRTVTDKLIETLQ